MNHSQCELLASDEMLRSVSATAYGKNFDEVRQRLKLGCKPGSVSFSSTATGWRLTARPGIFAHCAMHEDNPFSYCDNYFTTPGSRNETRAPHLFALSALTFVAAAGFSVWRLLPDANDGVMSCSTKAIMRFENMEKENVNGNIHFNFAANGNGSMVVEGYTDSAAGWLYLQRYVKFSYTSQRISATERHYRIKSGNPAPHPSTNRRMSSSTTSCAKCPTAMTVCSSTRKSLTTKLSC